MTYNLLRLLLFPIKYIWRKVIIFRKKYFNFILPNIEFFYSDRIKYKNYPICNQKIYLTGKGIIEIGSNCIFGYKLGGFYFNGLIEFQPRNKEAVIKIGNNVITNNNIFISSLNSITIGCNTLIGNNVSIFDYEAHGSRPELRHQLGEIGQVVIGENVWIGNNVTILKNSIIGDNSIIATGAVVTGIFSANTIIGGIPAKVIKSI